MRRSVPTFLRQVAYLGALALVGAVAPGLMTAARADDTPPPVVVNDVVSLYPGEVTVVDVLANDQATAGGDLALCRFPNSASTGDDVFLNADPTDAQGNVRVMANFDAAGTYVFDYYVCDHIHLTAATLTVEVRPVRPVKVTLVSGAAHRIRVYNKNDAPIRFVYGARHASAPDGSVKVAPGVTKIVRVERSVLDWAAYIGDGGLADHGRVRMQKR